MTESAATAHVPRWKASNSVVGLLVVRALIACAMGLSSPVLVYVVAMLVSWHEFLADSAKLVLVLAACLAVMGTFPSLANLIDAQIARLFSWRSQTALLESIESVTQMSPFEEPEYQALLHGASDAAEAYMRGAVVAINSAAQTLISMVGVLWLLAGQDWRMAVLPFLWGLPAIYLFGRASRNRMACFVESLHPRRRQMRFRAMATDMSTLGELKVDGAEPFVAKQALDSMAAAHSIELASDMRIARDQFFASALTALAAITPLVLCGWGGFGGTFQLAVVVQAALPLSGSLSQVGSSVATLSQAYRERSYLRAYLTRCAAEIRRCAPLNPSPLPSEHISSIIFDDVWFKYPGAAEYALRGLSLTLRQGQSYALTGENGSGKSTVLKLISGLYYPTRGRILVDGVDIRTLNLCDLRRRIAYLAQDSVRLDLSLRDNLLMGQDSSFDPEDALRIVGLDELVHRSSKGLQTVLCQAMIDNDESGTMISGGQWRRLAAARYWLRGGRDICLLDEPTNAIDAHGEAILLSGALGPRKDSIWLAVTHRPAVCDVADTTIVLAGGRLAPDRSAFVAVDDDEPPMMVSSSGRSR